MARRGGSSSIAVALPKVTFPVPAEPEPDGVHEDLRDLRPKMESARTDEWLAMSHAVLTRTERRIQATLRFYMLRRPCPHCGFESHRFEAGDETQCAPGTSDVPYTGAYACPSCLHDLQCTPTLSGGWEWRPLGRGPAWPVGAYEDETNGDRTPE